MSRKRSTFSENKLPKDLRVPKHPLISDHPVSIEAQRETLERVISVIELLKTLQIEEKLTPDAQQGLFYVQAMVAESVTYIRALSEQSPPH